MSSNSDATSSTASSATASASASSSTRQRRSRDEDAIREPYEFEDFYRGNQFLRDEDPAPPAPRYVLNRVSPSEYHSRSKLYTEMQLTELAELKHSARWTFQQIAALLSVLTKISIFLSVIIVCALSMWMAVRSIVYWSPPAQPTSIHDPLFWSVPQTVEWMNELGGVVGNYSELFSKSEIDGEMLFRVTDEDLESMGIDKVVTRKKILLEIEKLKATSKPYDFWSYRQRNKKKAEFLVVAFSNAPRLVILYLYFYEYEETLKPILGGDTTYMFWLCWLLAPYMMCIWYATAYWNLNPFLVIAFVQICLQNARLEVSVLAGRTPNIPLWVWLGTSLIPILHIVMTTVLPSSIMTFVFYLYFGFSLMGVIPIRKVESPKHKQHWPPPLEIPEISQRPPKTFVCPITHDIMKEPAVGNGTSFERSAIEEWVKIHQTDPISREPLSETDLVPNLALRTLIEEWISNVTAKDNKVQ